MNTTNDTLPENKQETDERADQLWRAAGFVKWAREKVPTCNGIIPMMDDAGLTDELAEAVVALDLDEAEGVEAVLAMVEAFEVSDGDTERLLAVFKERAKVRLDALRALPPLTEDEIVDCKTQDQILELILDTDDEVIEELDEIREESDLDFLAFWDAEVAAFRESDGNVENYVALLRGKVL